MINFNVKLFYFKETHLRLMISQLQILFFLIWVHQEVYIMVMQMRGDKCYPGRGKWMKIPLLPENVGNRSVNNLGTLRRVTTFNNKARFKFKIINYKKNCKNLYLATMLLEFNFYLFIKSNLNV